MVTIKPECKPEWIKNGANEEMIKFAKKWGREMAGIHEDLSIEEVEKRKKDKNNPLRIIGNMSNSQIRNVYGEIKRIQMSGNFEESKSSFYLLKPKVAYAYGRNGSNGLKLFKEIFDSAFQYVNDDNTYNNFCNLMEAILAYHRAFGG